MESKYQNLLERTVIIQEKSVAVQESIDKSINTLNTNMSKLNDNFVLHCSSQLEMKSAVFLIKKELLKLLTYLVLAIIAVAAGKEAVSLILK